MDLPKLLSSLSAVRQDVAALKESFGRSEEGRLVSVAATDLEKATWALKAAQEAAAPKDFVEG